MCLVCNATRWKSAPCFFFPAVPDVVVALVQVGILPWLFLTSRVSKMLCQKLGFVLVRP